MLSAGGLGLTFPAPYPADTRAKGWRLELDHERIRQSDTWAITPAEIRPWLLMLWMTAWEQTPCGSLPNDDALIAARIGMAPKAFAKCRDKLMRGWTLADDGRQYHAVLTQRVGEMLERRRKDAERKGKQRGIPPASPPNPHGVPRDADVTDGTSTGTGTGTGTGTSGETSTGRATPGEACMAMKAAGMGAVSPSNPTLIALLDAGITVAELAQAARDSVERGKPFAYALKMAESRRRDAARVGGLPGQMNAQEALEAANRAVVARALERDTNGPH
jgi:hypothetical protein